MFTLDTRPPTNTNFQVVNHSTPSKHAPTHRSNPFVSCPLLVWSECVERGSRPVSKLALHYVENVHLFSAPTSQIILHITLTWKMRLPQGWKRAKQTDTTHKVELEKSKTPKIGLGQFTTSLYPNWNEFIHFLCFCGGGLDFDFIFMPQPTSFFFIFSSLFSFALPLAHKQINDISTCYKYLVETANSRQLLGCLSEGIFKF